MTDAPQTTTPCHTPGPWHTCAKGKCSCFIVMSDDYPVASLTHGDWGDDYPAIRLVGSGSHDQKAEVYMKQNTYGSVNEATARANWHLIAAAPDLLLACKLAVTAMGDVVAAKTIQAAVDKAEGVAS